MIRRPPRSPLFPYTPLFRSLQRGRREVPLSRPAVFAAALPGRRRPASAAVVSEKSVRADNQDDGRAAARSEEHTSELQSPCNLVCRLLLEKKKKTTRAIYSRSSYVPKAQARNAISSPSTPSTPLSLPKVV